MSIERINGLAVFFAATKGPALRSEQDAPELSGDTNRRGHHIFAADLAALIAALSRA